MSKGEDLLDFQIRAVLKLEPVRECEYCNKHFIQKNYSKRHKGKFCSRECSVASKRTSGLCAYCGEAFYVNINRKKYCSMKCSAAHKSGCLNPSWNGGKEDRECVVCKNKFTEYKSQIKKTCSKECAAITPREVGGSKNPNWRGGKEVQCKTCGNLFWQSPSQERNLYCSVTCFHKADFSTRTSARWSSNSRWGYKGSKSGKRDDIGIFVRSSWEANYARYLNWLIQHNEIIEWQYEKETFEFKGIKKGTRFYTPDFRVKKINGDLEYHEVKGWMHQKGKTALSRMAKYYPQIKIILIQKKEYYAIAKIMKSLIPTWE